MKYLALLRGINVGGNNIIKMSGLKEAFEKNGYTNVKTYIQSGNVIFESRDENKEKHEFDIEEFVWTHFNIETKVLVRTKEEIERVVKEVPSSWNKDNVREYIAFVRSQVSQKEVFDEIEVNKGMDFKDLGHGVIYLTTKLEGLTKSKFNKLASKKIYKEITIRNFNTTKKILELMD